MVWPHTPTGSSRRRSSQMPSPKRASMREGPLAALFRKTADDPAAPGDPHEPEATTAPPEKEQRSQPAPSAEHEGHPVPARPHPGLETKPELEVEHHIPSPQERL